MNEELHQHLMEFVYGLLDEGEASALCERITSDPQVARAYATVKLQCDLVARAARYDAPTVAWSRPDGDVSSNASVQTAAKVGPELNYRTLANWCIGVAASGLICLMGSAYWLSSRPSPSESTPVAIASATPIQVVLTGPSELHAEASNPFTLRAKNQAGTPVATTLNCRVYDARGGISWENSTSTDNSGIAQFDVDAELARDASRLEISAADDSPTPILRELRTSPDQFVTYLRMDRPLFQPGERLWYRSVTLSRFGLRADREMTTSFEIVNASDELVEGSANTDDTEQGVGSGSLDLPSDLPDGTYTLIARSPDNLFREEWRDFQVRRFVAPQLLKKLELAQDSYTVGDQVEIEFSAKRVAGKPLADSPLRIQATADGIPLAAPEAKTDADGNSRFSLTLPDSIERGEASVSVTVQAGDDPAETITKEIPINLGKVNVDFFAEGGDLAAGLPSRVYYFGRDPLGKPAHIEGHIVDSDDKEITDVATVHDGRGVFSFTPLADKQYRLILDKPAGVTKEVPLPPTSADRFATIETGDGVFAANAAITFTLYQRSPPKPLIVAAYCRGAMVAQQTIDPDMYDVDPAKIATFRGQLGLPVQAQGVIRLTVFNAITAPPEPIAERLVYRRVGQKLDVRFTPDSETFAPGQAVQLDLAVHDENESPVPAALGIAIVDDAILNLADDKSMRMPTYFHLLTEIDSAEQLEDANFYLSDEPESFAALDSLLGTQGWRRFAEVPETQLAQSAEGGSMGGGFMGGVGGNWFSGADASSRFRSLAWADDAAPPISTAATIEVSEAIGRQPTRSSRSFSSSGAPFASSIVIASIVLLVMVGVASLRWARGNLSLRVFAAAVAIVALLVGAFNLPSKSTRSDVSFSEASPSASAVPVAVNDSDFAGGTQLVGGPVDELQAAPAEGFTFATDEAVPPPAAASARVVPIEADAAMGLDSPNVAPKAASRLSASPQRLGRATISEVGKEAAMLPYEEKKQEMTLSDAPPPPRPIAEPSAPSKAVDPLDKQGLLTDIAPESVAETFQKRQLIREYAAWSFEHRSDALPSDKSSSTVFWFPLFMADETGKASVYFNLPQHASNFRAIVEAHGAGRLGSGELLIESRKP